MMRCLKTLVVLSVTIVCSFSLETTSTRSTPEPINIIVENAPVPELAKNTSSMMDVLDVRTPPKIQNQIREKISSKYHHVGVAIPVEDDVDKLLEDSTKKVTFYKLERSTTPSSGLSTWVLLSNQDVPTTTKKSLVTKNTTEKPVKMFKPVFKQRSTTQKPTLSTSKTTTTVRVNTFSPSSKSTTTTSTRKPTKLTKVKASLLQGASTLATITTEATTTTEAATALPIEAKNGGQELTVEDNQKTKKTQKKKKKNKTRRRKPSKASKEGDNKLKEAESPGTQLYSYLRSEIIPVTVGMSLVGLLVTAGLASYYLQPFAALRRSDPVDRKDTGGGYYYQDSSYSNSMPEEEAIGKVIAGMPDDVLEVGSSYKSPRPQNVRYRHVDRRSQIYMNPYGSVEDVKLHDDRNNDSEGEDKKFVVGSIPQEAVTPAVVPEHGPRQLGGRFVVGSIPREYFSTGGASPRGMKLAERRRREAIPDESENEIPHFDSSEVLTKESTTLPSSTTEEDVTVTTDVTVKETTPHNVYNPDERPNTLFELLADLFKLKIKLGMELIQNITSSVTTYVSNVHTRLDQHYRKAQYKHV